MGTRRERPWRLVLLVLLALAAASCSDSDSGPTDSGDDTTIGPDGGTVAGSGGASVEIPPGALAVDTEISATGVPAEDALPEAARPYLVFHGGAQFGPEGTVFDLPVTISFPLDPPLAPGSAVNLLVWDETEGAWVDEGFPVTLAADGASLSAEVTHFSLFGCVGDVFDSFDAAFGDGSTAESAFSSYVAWFKANVTDIDRKGLYRDDCHEVKGLRFDLSYEVNYFPDGPQYQGAPYVAEGEVTPLQVSFVRAIDRVENGVVDFYYQLAVDVFLECCAPDLELSAEPANIGTGETSQVTAQVFCDSDPMAGHSVDFESLGGLGTLSPASAAVNAAGQATSTYTAGEDEGTDSVQGSISNCDGSENTDAATQIEIGGDWSADMTINWHQSIGSGPLISFSDAMSIHVNLDIEEGVVSGSGTGTHSISTDTDSDCAQTALNAPSFPVVVGGSATEETLEFSVVAYSIPLTLTITCYDDEGNPDNFNYPNYGFQESALMAQYISVNVPRQDGASDSGSGSDPEGGDIPITWNWSLTLSGPSR